MADTRTNTGRHRRLKWYIAFKLFGIEMRLGFEANGIHFVSGRRKGQLYLEQFLLHLLLFTVRVHRFVRGDDDRAPHDHPFWFVTFPLADYDETYLDARGSLRRRNVKAFRFHYRPAKHRHIVSLYGCVANGVLYEPKPVWTIVVNGPYLNRWGFWPEPDTFVPASDWERYCAEHKL